LIHFLAGECLTFEERFGKSFDQKPVLRVVNKIPRPQLKVSKCSKTFGFVFAMAHLCRGPGAKRDPDECRVRRRLSMRILKPPHSYAKLNLPTDEAHDLRKQVQLKR
jgi:hypothetical protein